MKNKYYPPTIEEFHVGFEYEMLLPNGKYHKQIFGDRIIHRELDEYNDDLMKIAHAICRVKYLDREDIESLGLKVEQKPIESFDEGTYWCKDSKEVVIFEFDENNNATTYPNIDIYNIEFKIKNISELKKLLEQLGI